MRGKYTVWLLAGAGLVIGLLVWMRIPRPPPELPVEPFDASGCYRGVAAFASAESKDQLALLGGEALAHVVRGLASVQESRQASVGTATLSIRCVESCNAWSKAASSAERAALFEAFRSCLGAELSTVAAQKDASNDYLQKVDATGSAHRVVQEAVVEVRARQLDAATGVGEPAREGQLVELGGNGNVVHQSLKVESVHEAR